jgi:hypothetical protein
MNNMIRNALLALVLGLSIRGYGQSACAQLGVNCSHPNIQQTQLPRGLPRIISLHLTVMTTLPAPPMLSSLQGFLSAEGLRQVFVSLACCQILKPSLAAGFLGGRFRRLDELAPDDWRRSNPRFQGEQFKMNLAIADRFYARSQTEKQCTPAQLALVGFSAFIPTSFPLLGPVAWSAWKRTQERPIWF